VKVDKNIKKKSSSLKYLSTDCNEDTVRVIICKYGSVINYSRTRHWWEHCSLPLTVVSQERSALMERPWRCADVVLIISSTLWKPARDWESVEWVEICPAALQSLSLTEYSSLDAQWWRFHAWDTVSAAPRARVRTW